MSGTEVAQRPDVIGDLKKKSLYDEIDGTKLAALRGRMEGLTDVEIVGALELAASLGLNPWNGEFFAAKGQGGRILLMVGRDGLLRKAEEFPDYRGYDCGVVYAGDEFRRVAPNPDGRTLRERAGVVHTQNGVPPTEEKPLGAWAVAERGNRPPRYFFARWEEYVPRLQQDKLEKTPWWRQPSIMIEKVPISVVHRTLCNLSGVYLPEEVERAMQETGRPDDALRAESVPVTTEAALREYILGLDAPMPLKEELADSIAELNRLSPNSWGLGTAQMSLPGRTAPELQRELNVIYEDIAAAKARKPVDSTAEEITDAEVVAEEPVDLEALEREKEGLEEALNDPGIGEREREEMSARLSVVYEQLKA